ncbi:MAG: hypothetical protein EOP39_21900 [Rubrivivax sp.]|nr:MAG: hypothetical protein EOP39_21900 [Rubrivivax sp.]
MRWFKHGFAHSLFNLFAQSSLTVRSQPTDCTDAIREAMLFMLGDRNDDPAQLKLVRRVRMAADVQELWFMRDGLMSVLAQQEGETAARQRLARLDSLFKDQLPPSLVQGRLRMRGG